MLEDRVESWAEPLRRLQERPVTQALIGEMDRAARAAHARLLVVELAVKDPNSDGLLVGICSHGASGTILVNVTNAGALLQPPTTPDPAPWLGVDVADGNDGVVTVDAVNPDGPAAATGIVEGDIVSALDGVAVSSVDQLRDAIAGHAANDVVTLTVIHSDQTSSDIEVTLGVAPPSLSHGSSSLSHGSSSGPTDTSPDSQSDGHHRHRQST